MINIENKININSNDFLLSVKTMFEEIIKYYRLNGDYTIKTAFDGLFLTEFAGLNDYISNYSKLKQNNLNLNHLIGFNLSIPFDFSFDCKQDVILTVLIRSEYCTDTRILQNKIYDVMRYTLLDNRFFWSGEIATDFEVTNQTNTNITKYRIASFSEYNQKDWLQTRIDDNYIISQQTYKFKIFKI